MSMQGTEMGRKQDKAKKAHDATEESNQQQKATTTQGKAKVN